MEMFTEKAQRFFPVIHMNFQPGSAALFQLFGGKLFQHPSVMNNAVSGSQLGELPQNMAGDQYSDIFFPV